MKQCLLELFSLTYLAPLLAQLNISHPASLFNGCGTPKASDIHQVTKGRLGAMEATEPEVKEQASGDATSNTDELRTLYVLVYPSPLFAAHWSLWLPYPSASGEASDVGDRVHATGDRLNGFQYEYLQDYNAKEDSRRPKSFAIGRIPGSITRTSRQVKAEAVVDSGSGTDLVVLNAFDQACRQVAVPGPSLNRVAPGDSTGAPSKKLEVKDCQWWIKQVVAHLVDAGIFFSLKGEEDIPHDRIEVLPKH